MSDKPQEQENPQPAPAPAPFARYVGFPAYWDDIPARDLSREQWETLTEEQQTRALTSGLFVIE